MNSEERQRLLGSRISCECGQVHEVPVREVLIEAGAVNRAAEVMRRQNLEGPVFLLADENTYRVAGERVSSVLGRAGIRVHERILESRPHADRELADTVADSVPEGTRTVVSCGSGTVTDLAKWSAHRAGLPFVAVGTAPSMNGYASGIAALVSGGLKATKPVTPAVAVICDLDVMTGAPMEMIRAGVGDLISKPFANADWRLSTHLRGGTFCTRPLELLRDLEECYMGRVHLLEKRDPETIAALTEALVYTGISVMLAGSTSTSSGSEHLICYVLDMLAYGAGRMPDLHGVQVGVGTAAVARLYERIMATDAPDMEAVESVWERGDGCLARCEGFFGPAFASVRAEFEKKRGGRERALAEAGRISREWNGIRDMVRPFLIPSDRIRDTLSRAHAKVTYRDLGVEPEVFRNVLTLAMCARSRYTVLDAAFAAGLIEGWADDVIERP